ncbi:hypothetical protein E8F20_05680 [Pseudomonas sp. BN415]|uniref:hypothetical protein n=1 Tax=Pseudomonas sp. BN415 TaxID=2567889 RepID=UPI00245847A4|nr:hypothetical protein [Pseudomonas sp. BN415]MDH4581365.1 hypothetical protein [Pseudomonas sp. BN415]
MYQLTTDADLVIRLDDNTTIRKGHRWWDDYEAWLAAGNTPSAADGVSFADEQARKLDVICAAYELEFSAIKRQYPDSERESWPMQLAESVALQADPGADAPFLEALVLARGMNETKTELATKVRAKHASYSAISASMTGRRHALERKVLAASTLEQIQAINW